MAASFFLELYLPVHQQAKSILCFFSSLMEELAVPLQEKLEDWKRNTVQIDKEHAKGIHSTCLRMLFS